jgi:hypothetical protein
MSLIIVSLLSMWALRSLDEQAFGAFPIAVGGWEGRTALKILALKASCDSPSIGHRRAFIGTMFDAAMTHRPAQPSITHWPDETAPQRSAP